MENTKEMAALVWLQIYRQLQDDKALLSAAAEDLLRLWDGEPVTVSESGRTFKISLVEVKESEIFDSAACLKDHPELREQYRKMKKGSSYFKAV